MYTIHWNEYHDPLNWGTTEKSGIKHLKESFPTTKVYLDPGGDDGWVCCECELTTNTLKKAIDLAKHYCIGNGVDVFSILKNKKVVFTEEDL